MVRVAGTDPGTTSLDVLILDDGTVADQARFAPEQLAADPELPARWLSERQPFDLVAGPSGYGLPLKRAADCTANDLALMALVRPDERGSQQGVPGFLRVVRALSGVGLPLVFLPGVIQLPTVPVHRKLNRIDLGTADKLAVAALAVAGQATPGDASFCLVELGSAFTACLVVSQGQVVAGLGGTAGPLGWRSAGGWDGEAAYLFSPLTKRDLFAGGVLSIGERGPAIAALRESVMQAVAGLRATAPFREVVLSGRLLEDEPQVTELIRTDLAGVVPVRILASLPGAWVKHAAQGAAVIADGLVGGRYAPVVAALALRRATGTVLDWLQHPRAALCRSWFETSV